MLENIDGVSELTWVVIRWRLCGY